MTLFKKKQIPIISAVVAAAGSSSRMADTDAAENIDKQLLLLDGVPVIARSIAALSACERIQEIIVVCREEAIADYYDIVKLYNFTTVKVVIKGGEDRQASVAAGISACSENAEYYAIHDGARPLVSPADINSCIDAAIKYGAAAVAVPVTDTIKMCDERGVVVTTPTRDRLWAVQTPQIFEAGLFRRALEQSALGARAYTDDCQLIESTGHLVVMSQGSHENIKITRPSDLAIASAILQFTQGDLIL